MRVLPTCLLAMLLTHVMSTTAQAEPLSPAQQRTILSEGEDAFRTGTALLDTDPAAARDAFHRAAERWSVLIDDGIVNGPLLYDLGNAQVQAGELGHGIATYRRAERFIPADARLTENLTYARTLVSPQFADGTNRSITHRLIGWHSSWDLGIRLGLFAVGWILLWGVLSIRQQRTVPGQWWLAGAGLVMSILFGGSVAIDMFGEEQTVGVLITDDVTVRKGDAESYQPTFDEPINRGVEFDILESRPLWLHVEFPSGETGWVPRDAVIEV